MKNKAAEICFDLRHSIVQKHSLIIREKADAPIWFTIRRGVGDQTDLVCETIFKPIWEKLKNSTASLKCG